MGGTSTDVALLVSDQLGNFELTTEGKIGPYAVGIPMVDMHTIGAGGGSIARVDAGGLLQVGPESAGADPGPACYRKGGTEATVSDANLVLGRLRSDAFLGGGMSLDESAARAVVASVAEPLGMTVEAAAQGIIDVANEHMTRALRVMSVQKGLDPAELTLACFGGAGGLHVCALAEALGIKKALVPMHAGVLSALGMLAAPRARHLSHTMNKLLQDVDDADLSAAIDQLARQGKQALVKEGINKKDIEVLSSADVRYRGQSYSINIQWQGSEKTSEAFHRKHETLYGHRLDQEVELVTLRVKVHGPRPHVSHLWRSEKKPGDVLKKVSISGSDEPVPVYLRDNLLEEVALYGPALIIEAVSTTYIESGWVCKLHNSGSLLLKRN
jgi:N-methylhydantoinase A